MLIWMLVLSAIPGSDWPMISYDAQRTARTSAQGAIRRPILAAQIDTAAYDYFLTATPDDSNARVELPTREALSGLSSEERRRWGMIPPLLDVVGNGELVVPPSAPGARWGKFLQDVPGMQRLSWTTTWGENAHFQLHSFEQGIANPRLVWDVPFEGAMYSPLVVVTDLDGDDCEEAVLSMWHGVIAFDIETGSEKARCMYREGHGRQYGFFGTYTAPNGSVYLVVIGDFAGHIGVLSWQDGELKALWSHLFDTQSEQGIDRRFTINTVGPDPIGDFNGDGHGEVLMNVFSEENDNRWHLIAYDLDTGEYRLDLPDVYLRGHADLDGDGVPELLTQYCPARPVGSNGELRVYRWGELIWSHPYGRWAIRTLPELPLTHISGATRGMEIPVTFGSLNRTSALFTSHVGGNALRALNLDESGPSVCDWRIDAPAEALLDGIACDEQSMLIRVRLGQEEHCTLSGSAIGLTPVARERVSRGTPQPLVLADERHGPQVIMADAMDRVLSWRISPNQEPKLLWQTPGRAMTTQTPQMVGLMAGDLNVDGSPEVLCVQERSDGSSRLVALDLDGHIGWYHDFPDFGGRAPVWNECGTTLWAVGRFLAPGRPGVLVSNRRSIMHSDETVVIDPRSNRIVWHRDIVEVRDPWTDTPWKHTRGYGGGPVALADLSGNGLDDIVLCYPAEYSVVAGEDGSQLFVENTGPLKGTDNFWVFSGNPLVADLNGDGQLETLWTSPNMILVFQHQSGHAELLWRTEPNDGTASYPAIGDTDGDGRLEIGVPGCQDGFRCVEAATGKTMWTIPADGTSASNCVCADINGDGAEEFVYANGRSLRAVAAHPGPDGTILWQLELPAEIGYIAIADVDADGSAEILAGGRDGVLYCVTG